MIIHAVNIHSGGGKILLDHLLSEQNFGKITHLICDIRYELPPELDPKIEIYKVPVSLMARWKAELILKKLDSLNDKVEILCFSNLPPAFKLKNKVILYLQNALLLPDIPLIGDTLKTKLRIIYEKIWLNFFWNNIDEAWVQLEWMKQKILTKNKTVLVKPFLPIFPKLPSLDIEYDFITVTGSAPHKRLLSLLEAWDEFPLPAPKLLVVMDTPTEKITSKLESLKDKNIEVKINISRDELFTLYTKSRAIIITSQIESFCLPLYEAKHFNLKIYAIKEKFNENILTNENFLEFKNNKINLSPVVIFQESQSDT